MQFIEQVLFRNIDKDVSPDGMDYSGRRVLNPLRDMLNGRYLSSVDGQDFTLESIRGTVEIANSFLSDGINECIGSYENIERNILVFFIWNNNGFHGVFTYSGTTGTVTRLLVDDPDNPVLNFSNNPRYSITGVGMMGDILVWTDNLNPQRYINITRNYGTINDFKISLIKIGPQNKPKLLTEIFNHGMGGFNTEDKTTDATVQSNRLAENSFQFAFKYIYFDNEESVLSPFSSLLLADGYGGDVIFSGERNKATITHTVDAIVAPILKRVDLCVRMNNESTWRVWKKVTTFGLEIAEDFYNDSPGELIPEVLSAKIYDVVPNKSKALTIFKNRIFLNINEEGLIVPSITITPSLTTDLDSTIPSSTPLFSPTKGTRPFIKKNGNYTVGVVASDKFGRYVGVYAKARISGENLAMTKSFDIRGLDQTPSTPSTSATDPLNKNGKRLNVALTGAGPESGKYSVVLTPDRQYESYFQTPAGALFYYREYDGIGEPSGDYRINNKVFVAQFKVNDNPWSFTYFVLPTEIPFIPDNTYYVRIINSEDQSIIEKVIDFIDGNIIVCGKFKGIDFETFQIYPILDHSGGAFVFIEIFKPKAANDIFYYEVAGPYSVNDVGELSTTAISNIEADAYYRGGMDSASEARDRNRKHFRFLPAPSEVHDGGVGRSEIVETAPKIVIETPSPTYLAGNVTSVSVASSLDNQGNEFTQKAYTPDYSKVAWSRGRAFTETSPEILNRPTTIRFSDSFIEGSNINGLNSFTFDNVYDKVGQDRSPITKIVSVGHILVAVHERQVTSIYVGEALLRAGAGGALTSKIEGVIGDDRKLIGELGSYHPESVQEINGRLFGWDIFSGVVWRYTVEGLVPISNNGMEGYFREKARRYFAQRDRLKFVSGVDKDNDEYLLTLPALYEPLDTVPVLGSGPSTTQPGAGMEDLEAWEDLGHEWDQTGTGAFETEIAGETSPWIKGDLVSVAGYTYNFSYQLQIFSETVNTDVDIEVALLDGSETVLDSQVFNYTGLQGGPVTEVISLMAALPGTHVGLRFINNSGASESKTVQLISFVFDTFVTSANASLTYDFVLNPSNYVAGQTYRLKIVPYKQGATDDEYIDISVHGDAITPIFTNLAYQVTTADPDEAFLLYIDFVYTGQSFLRMTIIDIDFPIQVELSTEGQTQIGETWAFNYEKNVWGHRYSFVPEYMGRLNNELLSFKNGRLYKHNTSDTHNNFYGVQYEREFTFAVNPQPNKVKTWCAAQIAAAALAVDESGTKKVIEVSNEHGQASYTRVKEFEKKEGVYYGPILKDVNTNPALLEGSQIALRNGKDMRSKSLTVTVRNDRTDEARLQKVNVVGEYSEASN